MQNVGSYVLSLKDRLEERNVDPQVASAQVLKTLGRFQKPQTLGPLLSETRLTEADLLQILQALVQDNLVSVQNGEYSLTDLGYKAHLIVAT